MPSPDTGFNSCHFFIVKLPNILYSQETNFPSSYLLPNLCWLASASIMPLGVLYTEVINGLLTTTSNIFWSPSCQFSQKCVTSVDFASLLKMPLSKSSMTLPPPGFPLASLPSPLSSAHSWNTYLCSPSKHLFMFLSFSRTIFKMPLFFKEWPAWKKQKQKQKNNLNYLCLKGWEIIIHRIKERDE